MPIFFILYTCVGRSVRYRFVEFIKKVMGKILEKTVKTMKNVHFSLFNLCDSRSNDRITA